jgi:hypothetical protein
MVVSQELEDEFESPEDIREAMMSSDMYTHPTLYDLFCRGLESGKIHGMDVRSISASLPDMLSVAYEAHCRIQLVCGMECQGYR